jgi:hypothetical protein
MLGLTFQDDAPSFDAGLSAFIDELGSAAAGGGQSGEARTRRRKLATRRHSRYEHRRSGSGIGQRSSDSRRARQSEADNHRAVSSALKRTQSCVASLACALGFEIADADTVSTVD